MKHNELLNSLRKGDAAVLASFEGHPELLNRLLTIAQNPIAWKPGMDRELMNANGAVNQTSLGFQYAIQTTTLIASEVIRQKFYEEAIADFASVLVGRGPWMASITQNMTFDAAGPFESGIQDGATRSQIDNVEVGLSPINVKNVPWYKGYTYSIPEVQQALASNNWDIVESKYKALTTNWQLGIQAVGFVGRKGNLTSFPGLLSNTGCTVNTTFIPKSISTMSAAQLDTFIAGIVQLYLTNCSEVRFPNRFVIPRSDWAGLGVPMVVGTTPLAVSRKQYIEDMFKGICGNDFKLLTTAYANKLRNAGYWATNGTNRYALYNNDRETLHMDIPVDLTIGAPATGNNFQWQGVGYGQFSGMNVFRVPEVMYFDAADSI